MAVFLELTTDAFEETFRRQHSREGGADQVRTTERAGRSNVRRPLRGLEIKDDTYAYVKILRADNSSVPLFDSGSPGGVTTEGTGNFLLQSVQEQRVEKQQIVETFGDSYVYFFGEQPRFLQCSAVLINSLDFNWEAEWLENYDRYMRGTRSVEQGARAYMFYDDNVVEGYFLNTQLTKSVETGMMVPMQFQFLVTNHRNVSLIGVEDGTLDSYPVRPSAQRYATKMGVTLTAADAAAKLFDLTSKSARNDKRDLESLKINNDIRKLLQRGTPGTVAASRRAQAVITQGLSVASDVVAQLNALEVSDPVQYDRIRDLITRTGRPLRSKIWKNIDEYIGAPPERNPYVDADASYIPQAQRNPALTTQESFDLFKDALQFLTCFGLEISRPKTMLRIGLLPRAGQRNIATWSPIPGLPFGASLDSTTQRGAQKGRQALADPLGSVLSSARDLFKTSTRVTANDPAALPLRPQSGWSSSFSPEAGYGTVGYGYNTGDLFGSGNSSGDPGYVPPEVFRRSGIPDQRSAFQRFVDRLPPGSALDKDGKPIGRQDVGTGVQGGFQIGGAPSPFSTSSVPGVLDPSGQGRLVDLRNPYGVKCPDPPGTVRWPRSGGSGSQGFSFPP